MRRYYEPPDDFDRAPLKCGHTSYIAMRCEECGHQHCADCTHLAHNGVMTCRGCVPATVALLNREIAELASLMGRTDLQATNAALLDDITDQITHRDGLLKFQAEQADKVNDGAAGMMTRNVKQADSNDRNPASTVTGKGVIRTSAESAGHATGDAYPVASDHLGTQMRGSAGDGTGRHQIQEAAHVTGEGRQRGHAKPAGYIPPSAAVLAGAIIRHAEGL